MSANSSEFSWSIMSEIKRQNVRRCLFERPDPEKLSEDLKRQDQIVSEPELKRFREKWAFDPETGPLNTGPYEFVPLDSLNEIPSFYTRGYSCSKSKPARIVRDGMCLAQCYIGVLSRPVSAKRKLDLGDGAERIHTNSENVENVNKLLLRRGVDSQFESLSASVTHAPDVADNKMCGGLYHSSVGLTRTSTVPTLPELSPTSRVKDGMTPPQVQTTMKDFLPSKKQRMNTKTLPRT